MANIDTEQSRRSAIDVTLPWRSVYIFPDGTLGVGERQAIGHMYSGVLSAAAAPVTDNPIFSRTGKFTLKQGHSDVNVSWGHKDARLKMPTAGVKELS